jgi:hypothetical protein
MIYPKGEPIHENLSSEYTDVPQLLSTLRSEGFSGIVEFISPSRKGAFLICSGDIIEAVVGSDVEPTLAVGDEAVEELLVLCTQPAAVLSVYKSSVEEVEFAASTVQSETVFKGLSTDFVRLDRFMRKLEEEKHTGYIEAFTKNDLPVGVLLLKYGSIESAFVYSESGKPELRKDNDARAFLQNLSSQSVVFSVYKSTLPLPKEVLVEPAKEPVEDIVEEVIVEASYEAMKEKLAPEVDVEPPVTEKVHPVLSSDNWIDVKEAMRLDIEKAVNAVANANGRSSFISDVQGILIKIERFVAGATEKGGFQKVFKRVCVEKSDTYPFLDPFEGQFDYSGGALRVDSLVPLDALCAGLADCLNQTLIYLQKELPKNATLPHGLIGEIESSFSAYLDILRNAGIPSIVPSSYR